MWNSLKSDLYRAFHSRYTYVIIVLLILTCFSIFSGIIQSNSVFAAYSSDTGTFTDFLFYFPKSNFFLLLPLIFIAMFATDEYNTGFIKNTYSLSLHKWHIIVERYVFYLLMMLLFFLIHLAAAFLFQLIQPIATATLDIGNYVIFCLVQLLILSAVGSFVTLLTYVSGSRVVCILFSGLYGMMMLYMLLMSINYFISGDGAFVDNYALYALAGKLPVVFSWDGYQHTLLVVLGSTILYNVSSWWLLCKKDIR